MTMGETKALDHGGRVEVGNVWLVVKPGDKSGECRVESLDDGSANVWWLSQQHDGLLYAGDFLDASRYRLISRISPPAVALKCMAQDHHAHSGPVTTGQIRGGITTANWCEAHWRVSRGEPPAVAPGERRLTSGWYRREWSGETYPCKCGSKDGERFAVGGKKWHCIPCAEAAGAFADAAPRAVERKLVVGWVRLAVPGVTATSKRQECLHRPVPSVFKFDCDALAVFDSEDLCACEAHAESMGVFAETGPTFAAGVDHAVPGSERTVEQVWQDGKCISEKVSAPRPLTYDEANPRPAKCQTLCKHAAGPECYALCWGKQFNPKKACKCPCHPVEAKQVPKVVGRYPIGARSVEAVSLASLREAHWQAAQLGRAHGIDRERIPERPAPKIRDIYRGEIDPDYVSGGDR
jgi:hypothetical protein